MGTLREKGQMLRRVWGKDPSKDMKKTRVSVDVLHPWPALGPETHPKRIKHPKKRRKCPSHFFRNGRQRGKRAGGGLSADNHIARWRQMVKGGGGGAERGRDRDREIERQRERRRERDTHTASERETERYGDRDRGRDKRQRQSDGRDADRERIQIQSDLKRHTYKRAED